MRFGDFLKNVRPCDPESRPPHFFTTVGSLGCAGYLHAQAGAAPPVLPCAGYLYAHQAGAALSAAQPAWALGPVQWTGLRQKV